jgi:transketolase
MEKLTIGELKAKTREIRRDLIKMLSNAGSGHSGGSLSSAEIMTSLFFNVMNHDSKNPTWDERDRFVLSKGHACPILYTTYAHAGYIPKEELMTFNKIGSRLQNHPGKIELPILEASTGSLGQGISVALGIALAAKLDKKKYSVFCLMGDGEQQEGSVWEAALLASQLKLDNLCVIIDANKVQLSGKTKDIVNVEPLKKKYEAFGWNVVSVNGNSIFWLLNAFKRYQWNRGSKKPFLIIANTIKGKGVSFMEGKYEWHGKAPDEKETAIALKEIG